MQHNRSSFMCKNRGFSALCLAQLIFILYALQFGGIARAQVQPAGKKMKSNPCGANISKCGCVITTSGLYELTKAPTNTTTLNADDSCIEVEAPRVSLFLEGNGLVNLGPVNGTGIHITSQAISSFVSGASTTAGPDSAISGWNVAIQDDANDVSLTNLAANGNNCEGVLVNRASGVSVSNFASDYNGAVGVWLNGAASSQVSNGMLVSTSPPNTQNNNIAGILISGTNPAIIVAPCLAPKGPSRPSRNVLLFRNSIENSSGIGLLVESNVHKSVISDNTSTGNAGGDLTDANNFCGSDVWFNNTSDPNQEFPCVP